MVTLTNKILDKLKEGVAISKEGEEMSVQQTGKEKKKKHSECVSSAY